MRASFAIQVTLLLVVTLYVVHVASWDICPFNYNETELNLALCSGICQLRCYNFNHTRQKVCRDECLGEYGSSRNRIACQVCSDKCDRPDKSCGSNSCSHCYKACNSWLCEKAVI